VRSLCSWPNVWPDDAAVAGFVDTAKTDSNSSHQFWRCEQFQFFWNDSSRQTKTGKGQE